MRTILINLIAVTSISFCASSMNAQSEKQHEFEEADRATPGCEQIPYSSLRGSCQDQAKHVHEWCDGEKGPLSCKEESTKIVSTIASESFTLERLQKQRRDLVDARDHGENQEAKNKYDAPIAAVDTQINESNRRTEDLKRSLDNRKNLVDKTMENINQCISYRQAVMNVFAEALDKVRQEGNDDASLRTLAQSLKGKYQDSKEGHEKAISLYTEALDKCRKERP